MKRSLMLATILSVGAIPNCSYPSHNYVGMGLGCSSSKSSGKQDIRLSNVDYNFKKKATDLFYLAGNIFLGRKFILENGAWVIEGKIRKDSNTVSLSNPVDDTDNDTKFENSVKLKRIFSFSLATGYYKEIYPTVNLYAKASVVLSKFQMQAKESIEKVGGAFRDITSVHMKKRYCIGVSPVIGISKDIDDFTLSLDYAFEYYPSLKWSGNIERGGGANPEGGFRIRPKYHHLTASISKKI